MDPSQINIPSQTDENADNSKKGQYLSCKMNDQSFAIEIMSVREIRGWTEPTPMPHVAPYLRGVINLRGTVLPIFDLAMRLGDASTDVDERNVIIVVENNDQLAGLLVDAVCDIVEIPEESLQPPPDVPDEKSDRSIAALSIIEEDMIRILDLPALLDPENLAA